MITAATFLAMSLPEVIIESVQHQLSSYNYTFPKGPRVSNLDDDVLSD